MSAPTLPGVYIEVRPEGLIVPGPVSVNNLGVVGTASKGPVGEPVLLGSLPEAREKFGAYDPWPATGTATLTLVRALELAYQHGATTVWAVRVADEAAGGAADAMLELTSVSGPNVRLVARTPGTWGNDLTANVGDPDGNAFVEDEDVDLAANQLAHSPVVKSAQTRIKVVPGGGGAEQILQVLYDEPGVPAPVAGQVKVTLNTGALAFGQAPPVGDTVLASYFVAKVNAKKVTIRSPDAEEVYHVASGTDLVSDLGRLSSLVTGEALPNASELPSDSAPAGAFPNFAGGRNGATGADYRSGLEKLLEVAAHIIVAAGQDESFGDELAAHCAVASGDDLKRERIAVVGSVDADLDAIGGHSLNSDRVILVAPGIVTADTAQTPPRDVVLPGAYSAAAVAGLISALRPHQSPTNKVLNVGGLEKQYTTSELIQLVKGRILALEVRQGHRVVKGITTSTNTAWHQITTRRIVDLAKLGIRSAGNPFIGRLNNERVRGALRTAINAFLAQMVVDEQIISYELEVSATRDEERQGIARVVVFLRPTFSIDFIKVTMFLE